MKKVQLLLLVCAGWFSAGDCFCQNKNRLEAWLDQQTIDGRQVISGWCRSHAAYTLNLKYRAVMDFGDSTDVRESTILAIPDQPTLLLKAVYAVSENEFETVTIDIFENDKLLVTTSLRGRTPNFTLPEEPKTSPPAAGQLSFDDLEIEGLVIDETRSKLAHDFYELFYNAWSQADSVAALPASIVIRELPSQIGIGSRVLVELDGLEFTQLALPPKPGILEEIAAQLSEALRNHLTNPDSEVKEIETEELLGTGIY